MSEIQIKEMKMPKYCRSCRFEFSSIHGPQCCITRKFTRLDDNEDGMKRHISCPLVKVPVEDKKWHTGTPTEEGWYLYEWGATGGAYATYRADTKEELAYLRDAIRWQKIEP